MSVFSPSIRVLLCLHCAGIVQAPYEGGLARCGQCGTPAKIGPRDASALGGDRPLPEHERLSRLRAQDGRPSQLPPSLQALAPFGHLEPWKVREAFDVWSATRQEVLRTGGFEAGERLVLLTVMLSGHLADQPAESLRQRALLESTLDILTLPRHRQTVRGYLCRAAARVGDLDGAEHWLRPCDARSEDLEMDTAYRLSRALVDTSRQRYAEVLTILGRDPAEVPIQDAADAACAVFRANAWERLGHLPQAAELLARAMRELGPAGRRAMEMTRAANHQLALCPASFALAERQHANIVAGTVGKTSYGPGLVGVLSLALGGLVTAVMVWAMGGGFLPSVVLVAVTLLICAPIGWAVMRAGQRVGRLQAHGVPGRARVLSVTPTGTLVNHTPEVRFDLEVHLAGKSPYQAHACSLIPFTALPMLVPGAHVAVRVDPQDPTAVALEAA